MKILLATAFVAAVAFQISAQTPGVTFIGHEKVAEALAKGATLATASNLRVSGNHRMGPGEVEVHEKETDIFYVTEGEATVVTGGTMVGGRQTGPGQLRGKDVKGGESRRLQKGDVMVIPAGTPHWFKNVSPTINYLTVKVVKP